MLSWKNRVTILVGALIFATAGALAQQKPEPPAKPEKQDKAADTNPGFEKLKQTRRRVGRRGRAQRGRG